MNADILLHKAHTDLASAKLLLESGDADGACNRAYYAMFDAARAALMAFQNSDEVLTIKTHSGLISSFSLQLVKPGLIDIELGKALNKDPTRLPKAKNWRCDTFGYSKKIEICDSEKADPSKCDFCNP